MPNFIRTSRIVGVAALAASTALSGPVAALAQQTPTVRLAQADAPPADAPPPPDEAPAEATPEGAVSEPAAAEPSAPEPAPPPAEAAPAPEAAPAEAAPEPEASEPPTAEPSAPEPAPEAAPAPAAAPEPAAPEAPPADAAPPAEAPPAVEAPPAAEAPATEPTEPPAAAAPASKADRAAQRKARQAERKAKQAVDEQTPAPDAETPPAADAAPVPESPAPGEPTGQAAPGAAEEAPTAPDASAPASDVPGVRKGRRGDGSTAPTGDAPLPTGEMPGAPPAPGDAPDQPNAATIPPAAAPVSDPAAPPPAGQPKPVAADIQNEAVPEGGVAASDARVQQLAQPVEVPSVKAVQGERIAAPTRSRTNIDNSTTNNTTTVNNTTITQTQLPPGATVVDRVGDRDIISIVGAGVAGAVAGGVAGYFIRGNDDERLATGAQDRYYEQLPERRRRETVVRENGTQIVTITNRYGDVIQRSKILPGGREVVLFYDPYERDDDSPQYYTDPGADLPPIDLAIPRDEYIVDTRVPDEDLYYRTMVAPPVETVERIYSIDEVRRSERIRDKVRRIDLNTINFDFGSDAIAQTQVPNLEALADAIAQIVDKNPAETFLIEGHTDAVGSEVANLALSDRRAEAVASALSQYFDVPPENLVTQGYGESDLKVDTQAQSAENRRVTVRRITALVKPVDTAAR